MGNQREIHDLIETLDRHRNFLLVPAQGLTKEQARATPTASSLCIASLLKHVADTEESWMYFANHGHMEVAEVAGDEDKRFLLDPSDTLESLVARVREVGRSTAQILESADLDVEHELPDEPWFTPGTFWSVRRVALHVLAEIAQHAGHADIIRESIDGQLSMG